LYSRSTCSKFGVPLVVCAGGALEHVSGIVELMDGTMLWAESIQQNQQQQHLRGTSTRVARVLFTSQLGVKPPQWSKGSPLEGFNLQIDPTPTGRSVIAGRIQHQKPHMSGK